MPGIGQAKLVDFALTEFGSRVGAWRRLGNDTLDLVLVGVPRAVTGSLLPTWLVEGSPEDHRHSSVLEEESPEATTMPPSNGGGGRPQSHGQDVITRESGRRHGSLTESGVEEVDEGGKG